MLFFLFCFVLLKNGVRGGVSLYNVVKFLTINISKSFSKKGSDTFTYGMYMSIGIISFSCSASLRAMG